MTADLPPLPQGSVVTVGSFDGMHRGHLAVLREVVRRAREAGRRSVLVTFEPHPAEVLHPEKAPARLTPDEERREILAETGLDYAVVLRFDRALAGLAPEEFVQRILLARYSLRELVLGEDHGFGRGRSGDLRTLPPLGARLGFSVDVVAPVRDSTGQPISSTGIRAAIAQGDLTRAAEWLGRPYRLAAEVAAGDRRGRTIGVPTINLEPPPRKLLPPDGVYAAWVEWAGGRAGAMMNQGPRPTVRDRRRLLEAHLFDFDGDLYGRRVRVEWVARLRDVQQFESLAALQAQLELDGQRARSALAAGRHPSTACRATDTMA